MSQTIRKLEKFFRPICKNSGDILRSSMTTVAKHIAKIEIKFQLIYLEKYQGPFAIGLIEQTMMLARSHKT